MSKWRYEGKRKKHRWRYFWCIRHFNFYSEILLQLFILKSEPNFHKLKSAILNFSAILDINETIQVEKSFNAPKDILKTVPGLKIQIQTDL
jgi:hypothetical protein